MSELTTEPAEALANALHSLGGPANGHLLYSEDEMLARVHSILGATVSHLTTSRNQLLAGIRNAISGAADLSALTSSDAAILADIAGVSRLSVEAADLWDRAMTVIGGAGGGTPANALTLNGQPLTLNGQTLTLGA